MAAQAPLPAKGLPSLKPLSAASTNKTFPTGQHFFSWSRCSMIPSFDRGGQDVRSWAPGKLGYYPILIAMSDSDDG
jgi:hypothetical protein